MSGCVALEREDGGGCGKRSSKVFFLFGFLFQLIILERFLLNGTYHSVSARHIFPP